MEEVADFLKNRFQRYESNPFYVTKRVILIGAVIN